MAKACCVDGCLAKDDIYFRFPNSRTLCKKWMEAVQLSTKPGHNSVLCSAHFTPDDYALVRGKVRLKPKVIPHLHKNEKLNTNKTFDNSLIKSEKDGNQSAEKRTSKEDDRMQQNDAKEDIKNKRVENKTPKNNVDNANDKESTQHRKNALKKRKQNGKVQNSSRSRGKRKSKSYNAKDLTNKINMEGKPSEGANETMRPSAVAAPEKEDIEEFLTYFHIKQNKDVAERQNAELERERKQNGGGGEGEVIDLAEQETEAEPVFIEVSVDKDNPEGRGSGSPRDCLMVMESVQVELDPNDLLLPEMEVQERVEPILIDDKPEEAEEAISLLTSSDEDDVILQEPHIDTVVVSDESESEAVPLFVCGSCGRSTASRVELRKHRARHRAEAQRRRKKRSGLCK